MTEQIQRELGILKLLGSRKLLPVQISEISGLDIYETQTLVGELLKRGLIAKKSDGFSTFLYITPQGSDLVNGNS